MSSTHEAMLDDVAVYALGALPLGDAARVREHLASCESCAQEYHALTPAVAAVAATAEACPDAKHGDVFASPLLKARIMREVRRDAHESAAPPRASRAIVWPTYLVAAACFAIVIVSSLVNLSLMEQLKSSQAQVARTHEASTAIARDLSTERATLADLTNDRAKRYDVRDGQVVLVDHRLYIALHDLPAPPRGKVYQAWTLPKGGKQMAPSLTFVPDSHGAAVIFIPVNAAKTAAVAVSIEPEGGSKAPTSKPVVLQSLD